MSTKLTINWIGTPKEINTKFGLKQKNSIKANEFAEGEYLSYWVSPVTSQWKVGEVIEVDAVTPREYNGKTYYDIQMPKANHGNNVDVMKKMEEILNGMTTIKLNIAEIKLAIVELLADKRSRMGESMSGATSTTSVDYPEDLPEDDGIPF